MIPAIVFVAVLFGIHSDFSNRDNVATYSVNDSCAVQAEKNGGVTKSTKCN